MPPGYTVARVDGCGPGARDLWAAVLDEHDRRGPHDVPATVAEVLQPYERSTYLAFEPAALGPADWLGPPLVLLAGPGFDGPLATRVVDEGAGGFDPSGLRRGAPCRLRIGAGPDEDREYVLSIGDALDLELDPAALTAEPDRSRGRYACLTDLTPASQHANRAERAVELLADAGVGDGLGWRERLRKLPNGPKPSGDLAALIDGWTAVLAGEEPTTPTVLLGRGPGATPSGDDVLSGTLLALDRVSSGPQHRRVRAAGERLVAAAGERTTTVSTALLAQAARGRAGGRIDAALDALLGIDDTAHELGPVIEGAAQVGHTSGVDLLVGVLLVPLAIGPRLASGR